MIRTGRRGARPSYQALAPRVRRRLTALSLLRALGSATVLIAVYYLLPLDPSDNGLAVSLGLVGGLLTFVAVLGVQVWQITRSDYPRLRAVESIATAIPLFLVVFAATYFVLGERAGTFSEPLDRTDALYFTVTVFSTVGFGDITPLSQPARIVTMIQMLADLAVLGVVARVIVGAVGAGLRRRTDTADAPDTGPRP